MAELKRNFLGSKMNISLDDRILPPGEYRLAWNVNVSLSENSDVGALENTRGNRAILEDGITQKGGDYVDMGVAVDSLEDKLYYFFVGPSTEGIYEFDLSVDPETGNPRNDVHRICEFSTSRRVLEFRTSHLITGANVIDELLYWTDGINPPRKININRFRGSGVLQNPDLPYNAVTNKVVSQKDPVVDGNGEPLVGLSALNVMVDPDSQIDYIEPFISDHINVIKRPPLHAPGATCPAVSESDGTVEVDAMTGETPNDLPNTDEVQAQTDLDRISCYLLSITRTD